MVRDATPLLQSTGKEVKTSFGRVREGFSEEVAVEEASGGN